MQYSAQRQSGSVIVYVIVGVLLAAATVGAIIVAQNRGDQRIASRPTTETSQDRDTPPAQTDDEEADKDATEQKAAEEKSRAEAERQAKEKEKEKEKAAAEQRAAEQEAEEQKAKEQAVAEQEEAAQQSDTLAQTGGEQPTAADNLPTTGPVQDTLGAVIGLIAIASAGYVYYHSFRRG